MKTKNIFLSFVLNLVFITTFAQGENNNWYFGNKAALNFSNTVPTVINNSAMNSLEGCGSISDSNGNLLFYADAGNIWNRQNQIMPNGVLLSIFNYNTSQQLAIVKNPANNNQYYVFTTGVNGFNYSNTNGGYRINYSIVDMTLGPVDNTGSPLGDVLPSFKNIPILDNLGNVFFSEAITIIPNTNNNHSFWVLIPHGTKLYSYQLDTNGLSTNPIISNLSFPVNLNQGQHYSIKPSPKITNNNYSHYICISNWVDSSDLNLPDSAFTNKVYSFNSITGQITNDFSLQVNSKRTYSPEFNKNSSVLFLGARDVYAVDLINSTSSAVQSMMIYDDPIPPSYTEGMTIQRNTRDDIYVSRPGKNFLAQIINPNVYGSNISINLNAVNLGNGSTKYGLPQIIPVQSREYYPCIDSLTLISEPNSNFNYEVGNKITTKNNYVLGAKYDITMKAGASINLLPGTNIQVGAQYHAFIGGCRKESIYSRQSKSSQQNMVLNLDIEERKTLNKQLEIHPNPASTFINIDSGNEKITSWELFDISGRSILKGSSNKVNVQGLPKTTYLLNININNKITTKKVIVK